MPGHHEREPPHKERGTPFRHRFMAIPHRGTLAIAYWFAFFATLIFAGSYAVHSWHRYERNGHARLGLTTTMIAVATRDVLASQASQLAFLAQELRRTQAYHYPRLARALLMQYKGISPEIVSANLIAPNGQVLASTAVAPGHSLPNLRMNPVIWPDLHRALRDHGLYIYRPFRGPLVQKWVICLSYTVFAPSGKPLFLVATPMRFNGFGGFLKHLPLPRGMAVGLLRDDYYIEGRQPIPHGNLHALLAKPQAGILVHILKNHPIARRGSFDGWVTTDHLYRFGAFVRVPGYPLIAFADVPRDQWVAAWWRRYIEIPLIFLIASLSFSGVAYSRIQALGRQWEEDKERQKGILRGLIHHDPLTGLLNRMGLHPILKRALARADRHERLLGIGFLDVDEFKAINDRYGHPAGDAVLKELAGRLKAAVRGTDMVARLGGDEFVLIIEGLRSLGDLDLVVENIRVALARAFVIPERSLMVQVSLGLTVYPLDEADVDGLLRHADQAMYAAKARPSGSRDWVQMYHSRLSTVVTDKEGGVQPPPTDGAPH